MNELLSNDFIEFCSSGNVYYYNKGDVLNKNNNLFGINWEIKTFYNKIIVR